MENETFRMDRRERGKELAPQSRQRWETNHEAEEAESSNPLPRLARRSFLVYTGTIPMEPPAKSGSRGPVQLVHRQFTQ